MPHSMPKWKKGETDFEVSVNDDGNGGYLCRLPKPLVEILGLDGRIRFQKIGTKVEVSKPR